MGDGLCGTFRYQPKDFFVTDTIMFIIFYNVIVFFCGYNAFFLLKCWI